MKGAVLAVVIVVGMTGAVLVAPAEGATGWQSPVTLSPAGDSASSPQVVVDSAGDAIASWLDYPSAGGYAVDAARLAFGGSWSTPATLATDSNNMQDNELAGDARGDAVVDWEQGLSEGVASATYSGSSGTWAQPVTVPVTGFPSGLGMDSAGQAIGLFHTCPYCESGNGTGANNGLVETTLPFGGSWTSQSEIAGYGSGAGDADASVLAENAAGDAVAAWEQGDGSYTDLAAQVLPSGPSTGTSMDEVNKPVVATDAGGDATVVYEDNALSAYVPLVSVTYDARTGTWGPVEQVGNTPTFGGSAYAVASDAAGDVTVVWQQQTQNSSAPASIQMAVLSAGATSWSTPQTLSPATSFASQPAIAEDANGDRVVIWYATENSGTNNQRSALEAAVAPAGGGFGAAQTVATPAQSNSPDQVAIDPQGDAVAVWEGTGSTIEAASFLAQAPTPPPGSGGSTPPPSGSGGSTPPGSGSGSGSGGSTPVPSGSQRVKLSGAPVATANGVKVKVVCSAPAGESCQVTETLTSLETLIGGKPVAVAAAGKVKRSVVVATRTVTIAAGKTVTVTVTLNGRGRSLLGRFKRLPVELTIKLRQGAHPATVAARRLTIRAAKKTHHG